MRPALWNYCETGTWNRIHGPLWNHVEPDSQDLGVEPDSRFLIPQRRYQQYHDHHEDLEDQAERCNFSGFHLRETPLVCRESPALRLARRFSRL